MAGSVTRVSNSNPSPMSRQNICFFVLPMASRKAISLRRLRCGTESAYQPQEHIHQQEYHHNRLRIHLVHIAFHHFKLILLLRIRHNVGYEHIVGVQVRGYFFQKFAPVIGSPSPCFPSRGKQSAPIIPQFRSVSHSRQFSGKPTLHRPHSDRNGNCRSCRTALPHSRYLRTSSREYPKRSRAPFPYNSRPYPRSASHNCRT